MVSNVTVALYYSNHAASTDEADWYASMPQLSANMHMHMLATSVDTGQEQYTAEQPDKMDCT